MLPPIPPGWSSLLGAETGKPYYRSLDTFLDQQLAQGHSLLPERDNIFNALRFTPHEEVKVLLLGQDPYPTPGYAHGLSFSILPEVRTIPGSLRNIYKELNTDLGCRIPNNGYLEPWARQGVLLLNTILTLRASEANSHRAQGWEQFTDRIIQLVAARPTRVVFLLWGASAQKKAALVTQPQHTVIQCAHPSPLSAKLFLGCRCFSQTNQHLSDAGLAPIDWQIPDV
jgi:uracil-DNA glycosylase